VGAQGWNINEIVDDRQLAAWFEYDTLFGVWGKSRWGWWLLVVMRLAHCWVLEQQDSFWSWVAPLFVGWLRVVGGELLLVSRT
jgi:hypothetical protein